MESSHVLVQKFLGGMTEEHLASLLSSAKWVERVLGTAWVSQVILTKDKTVIKGDFLIDDKPVITRAQDPPDWEHILYDRPYNRGIKRKRITWENWRDILPSSEQV